MSKKIGKRLLEIADVLYEGNKSEMARDLGKRPQNLYQYTSEARAPGAAFLMELCYNGVNINWVLTGKGEMLIKEETQTASEKERSEYTPKERKVGKLIKLIIQRLNEVDYSEDVKLKILKNALEQIAIEQNTHFIQQELDND
jgi:hypothetical protein